MLECEVVGSAPFSVCLGKNHKLVSPDEKYKIISQGSLTSLEINSFESSDAAEYECIVSNEVESIISKSVAKQKG